MRGFLIFTRILPTFRVLSRPILHGLPLLPSHSLHEISMMTIGSLCMLVSLALSVSLPVRAQDASVDTSSRSLAPDSLETQMESMPGLEEGNTFQFLPRFDAQQDDAGFKLLPNHYDDANVTRLDRQPQIIKKVEPEYPEAAKRAGIEGTVFVNMLVGKNGRVKKAVPIKSDAEILNDAAVAAAEQFLFTPAIADGKPVEVWVAYPFRFETEGKK
jgi:TonB family protein